MEPGVGAAEERAGHRVGHECPVGGVGQGLPHAQQEQHGIDEPQARLVDRDGDGQERERRAPAGADRHDQHAARQPVGEGAAEQGEQQPGQLLGEHAGGHGCRVGGDGGDEQWSGGEHGAVAEVGDGGDRPEAGEGRGQGGAGRGHDEALPKC